LFVQGLKLSASGQELGSSLVFSKRIGFSGTPSDLLPVELGQCHYEQLSDGRMVNYLTSPSVCARHLVQPGWTVVSLLNTIANFNPPLHALIDTGALVRSTCVMFALDFVFCFFVFLLSLGSSLCFVISFTILASNDFS
jgi:hypothetical protein